MINGQKKKKTKEILCGSHKTNNTQFNDYGCGRKGRLNLKKKKIKKQKDLVSGPPRENKINQFKEFKGI